MMDVFKTSIYISIPIILIALLKNKILSKYSFLVNKNIPIVINIYLLLDKCLL